ncbi:MazG nucleotide pyrophosphohydrolase domain-containing protein [Candidatus Electronema sp. PJ]|uniref:MazG nucleotide pyrophosphohydrolase domain-containing protein n=1 Tax=Candidatus Electronema sp. PJ TaxID=3401572 RepID=UPI003AA9C1D0
MPSQPEAPQPVNPFQQLEALVKRLRSEQGCPWDQAQTTVSLKKYLLEEAAELAEAIDQGDFALICEEAGDLYFVLTLLLVICEEQGACSPAAALNAISAKMLRRHPHVFAAPEGAIFSPEQLKAQWQRIKEEEKQGKYE